MIAKGFTPKKGVEGFAIMERDAGGAEGVIPVGLKGLFVPVGLDGLGVSGRGCGRDWRPADHSH